ncbi:unnamed protein product [Closterium sp. Naga37s-1]|nr:unnamed protein product [Closterium sp. Naga37s-1]
MTPKYVLFLSPNSLTPPPPLSSSPPCPLAIFQVVIQVSCGDSHAAAVSNTGLLQTWGFHTAAVDARGEMYTWEGGLLGQLGHLGKDQVHVERGVTGAVGAPDVVGSGRHMGSLFIPASHPPSSSHHPTLPLHPTIPPSLYIPPSHPPSTSHHLTLPLHLRYWQGRAAGHGPHLLLN